MKGFLPNEYKNFNCSLLYKASVHGFQASTYHSKVDGIPFTITIITVENGRRFGVYTPSVSSSSNTYVADETLTSFIFSLDKKTKFTLKIVCKDNAIYDISNCGPSFGTGNDIYISDKSNENSNSYTNLLAAYENNSLNMTNGTEAAKNYLAGSYNFKTKEIEVLQLLK